VAFIRLADKGILLPWTVKSIERICVSFLAAASLGVVIGLVAGWSRKVRESSEPIIEVLRPIPPIAWIPLALAWFGTGRGYEMWIIGVAVFFPTLISTLTGVASVDPTTIHTALTMGARQWRVFKDVILPGALPSILSGLRIGWGFGWWSLVTAEMIGATSGLGWLIFSAYQSAFDLAAVMAGMVMVGAIGLISYRGFLFLECRLLRWRAA
jgi:ABC-type nitrate/sulfonate/bicarbonate transport system permease component